MIAYTTRDQGRTKLDAERLLQSKVEYFQLALLLIALSSRKFLVHVSDLPTTRPQARHFQGLACASDFRVGGIWADDQLCRDVMSSDIWDNQFLVASCIPVTTVQVLYTKILLLFLLGSPHTHPRASSGNSALMSYARSSVRRVPLPPTPFLGYDTLSVMAFVMSI